MVEIPQTCYDEYENFVSETVNSKDLLNFKSNNHYTYMLEHVSKEQGLEYLNQSIDLRIKIFGNFK